jgi:antitoxin component of MazEF toxin-antitoxin module
LKRFHTRLFAETATMKLIVKRIGDDLVLVLPKEIVKELTWRHGDESNASFEEHALRVAFVQSAHDRGMAIARKAAVDYKETFEALAKA